MSTFRSLLLYSTVALACLTACESSMPVDTMALRHDAHFWQRSDTSSAIYLRGPKAQQMLNRDISRCVTEVRELQRLGAIRRVTPAEIEDYGLVPEIETPEGQLSEWDTPERDGYLRAEHLDFHDFETCMIDKGWERVKNVPYDVAEQSREDYIDAIIGEHYQTRYMNFGLNGEPPPSDFDDIYND